MVNLDILEQLAKTYPSVDESHLSALAAIWSIERDRIIERMIDISNDEFGPVPLDAKPEALFELAKAILWLERQIIQQKTQTVAIECIDPDQERFALETSTVQDRIENTARRIADEVWKRCHDEWSRRFPGLVEAQERRSRSRKGRRLIVSRESSGVKNQHFSPTSTNEFWAIGQQKLIRIYERGIDQSIRSCDRGYTTWGQAPFLYSQRLERWFRLIEGDAKVPYTKLLSIIPLSENERRCWIAFLVTQILRTPSSILKILPRLKRFIETEDIAFPVTTDKLRQVYETIFTNNDIFAEFYRLITGYQWELWSAPVNGQFIRSDDPILICGSADRGSWQLVYPMSPDKCFVAGPSKIENAPSVVPRNGELDDVRLRRINERIARSARRSVIARPVEDDSTLRMLLNSALGGLDQTSGWQQRLFPEFWGPIE